MRQKTRFLLAGLVWCMAAMAWAGLWFFVRRSGAGPRVEIVQLLSESDSASVVETAPQERRRDIDDADTTEQVGDKGSGVCCNVNTATPEQLTALPGIGPVIAERIMVSRDTLSFSSLKDLRRVKGIGPKKATALDSLVCF